MITLGHEEMIDIGSKSEPFIVARSAYNKPLIIELSTAESTQGMGVTMLLMRAKISIGAENDFLLNPRSVS